MQWRRANINHEHDDLKQSQKYTHKHTPTQHAWIRSYKWINKVLWLTSFKTCKFMSLFNHHCCAFWTHIAMMNSHSWCYINFLSLSFSHSKKILTNNNMQYGAQTMTQWCKVQRTTMQESNHKKIMAFIVWCNFKP